MAVKFLFATCALVLLAFSMGASSCQQRVEFTVFHTNDLHSHLKSAPSEPFGLGGLARLSTLLHRLRTEKPHSFYFDAGDWAEGSWYYSIDTGANMLRFLDLLGCDGTVLGDHDFLNGPDRMMQTIRMANPSFPVLAGNLETGQYSKGEELHRTIPSSYIKEVGGFRIGVIGIATSSILFDSFLEPIKTVNPIQAAARLVDEIRPRVDAVIVISHNDFFMNQAMAKFVKGIDLIISGHSHRKKPHPVMIKGPDREVPIVESGKWGAFLGQADLEFDPIARRLRVKEYTLHPVTPDIPEDPVVAQLVLEQDKKLSQQFGDDIGRVVGELEFDMHHQDTVESSMGVLMVRAYRASTGTDVALEESGFTGSDVPRGPITLMSVHDIAPHIYNPDTGKEWTLHRWNAKGSDLQTIFRIFYRVNGFMPPGWTLGWLFSDNLHFTWDPTLMIGGMHRGIPSFFEIVRSITIGERPLDPHARYSVALTDGLIRAFKIGGEKLKLNLDFSQLEDTGIEAWRSVLDYIVSRKRLTKENLRVGQTSKTLGPDLAILEYGIEWDKTHLLIEVENLGLKPSRDGQVHCASGVRDGYALFESDEQRWTPIGEASVPALKPDQRVQVRIPWVASGLAAGKWPVRCEAKLRRDRYKDNNVAQRVFIR